MKRVLLVDAGNSSCKWGLYDQSSNEHVWLSHGACFYDEWDDDDSMLSAAWQELETPLRVVVSNVAGEEFAENLEHWVSRQWNVKPEYIKAQAAEQGVSNAYVQPEQLGSDRWMALLAAHHDYRNSVCIIDCGTAITVDVMDANGKHLGGMILPGLDMMQDWLLEDTQIKLPENPASGESQASLFARDTLGAVQSGTLYAVIAFIDRVTDDIISAMDNDIDIILTGGDAGRLLPLLSTDCLHEPDLVLKGLMVIAQG